MKNLLFLILPLFIFSCDRISEPYTDEQAEEKMTLEQMKILNKNITPYFIIKDSINNEITIYDYSYMLRYEATLMNNSDLMSPVTQGEFITYLIVMLLLGTLFGGILFGVIFSPLQ